MLELSDTAKAIMFDDLAEERNENEQLIKQLRIEIAGLNMRLATIAWGLESALCIAKDIPMPTDEKLPQKSTQKRKVGAGKTAA